MKRNGVERWGCWRAVGAPPQVKSQVEVMVGPVQGSYTRGVAGSTPAVPTGPDLRFLRGPRNGRAMLARVDIHF